MYPSPPRSTKPTTEVSIDSWVVRHRPPGASTSNGGYWEKESVVVVVDVGAPVVDVDDVSGWAVPVVSVPELGEPAHDPTIAEISPMAAADWRALITQF